MKDNTSLVAGSGYPIEKSESLSLFLFYNSSAAPMLTKSLKLSFRSFCILAVGPSFEAQRDSRAVRVKGQTRRAKGSRSTSHRTTKS